MRSGWNASSASSFSPVPTSLIGWPVTARMLSAAPPRASPSIRVEHDAGDADPLVERAREIDRVLAGQRVGDQQRLVRPHPVAHARELAHQLLVDVQPPGGVEDHHVEPLALRGLERARGDRERRFARHDRQALDARLARQHGELLLRRRALHVERGEQRLLPLAGPAGAARAWRWSWSCPSPAGRPSARPAAARRSARGRSPRRRAARPGGR